MILCEVRVLVASSVSKVSRIISNSLSSPSACRKNIASTAPRLGTPIEKAVNDTIQFMDLSMMALGDV